MSNDVGIKIHSKDDLIEPFLIQKKCCQRNADTLIIRFEKSPFWCIINYDYQLFEGFAPEAFMENILYVIIGILLSVVAIYFTLCYIRQRANVKRSYNMVFLYIQIPKKEAKEDMEKESAAYSTSSDFKDILGVMEHLFSSLNAIYSPDFKNKFIGQDFLSFEYAVIEGQMRFYCVVPSHLVDLIEKQITSFYVDAYIEEVTDYNIFKPDCAVAGTYIKTSKHFKLPVKTYQQLKSDPLNSMANALSKISDEEGAAIQFIIRPVASGWQDQSSKEAQRIYNKKKPVNWFNPISILGTLFSIMVRGAQDEDLKDSPDSSAADKITPIEEEQVKAIDAKSNSVGYETLIRVVTAAPTQRQAQSHLTNIVGSFEQFSDTKNNSFDVTKYHSVNKLVKGFIFRNPTGGALYSLLNKRMLLSAEELASLYHFPNIKYNRGNNIDWQLIKIAPGPKELPQEGLTLGYNVYRGQKRKVCMKDGDRFRHLYIIGQTGMGKSQMLEYLAMQDVQKHGCCIVDPHGDLVEDILGWIPRNRADDVIVFDPADLERPMGLNMLEAETPEEMDFVALEAMNMMIKLFGNEIFGPRIQDYFRNGCLTLMADKENGGAITDIVRLFTDDEWQAYKVKQVSNPIVKSFWEKQMAQTGQREKQEMIPYFAAKFGQFTTNTMIRNILGQTKSAFDVNDVMNNGKILLIKLSKGLVGDINANLMGMMIVNKIQVAAMRRQSMAKEDRKDFFLYVDEFQNFITEAFESILSEARKYRLGLVIAHQYISQLVTEKDEKIKNAVFGNVGTMMNFKIGAADAEYMAKEMAPTFADQDLINLRGFQTCIKLSIDNIISQPFSMNTVKVWELPDKKDEEAAEAYKQLSRLKYGREKEFVEREILKRIGA